MLIQRYIIVVILFLQFSLAYTQEETPAYRFNFADKDRASNAMLQNFQKKDMKLYTFVPDADQPAPTTGTDQVILPAGWQGSYRTGDRRLFAGDRLRLYTDDKLPATAIALKLSRGQPLRWGQTQTLSLTDLGVSRDGDAWLWTVPPERDRQYLREIRFTPTISVQIRSLDIFRAIKNTRLDAEAILAIPPLRNVEVMNVGGIPCVTIDGQPFDSLGYGSFIHQQYGDYPKLIGETGYGLAYFVINLGEDILTKWNPPSWIGPDHFDFSSVDSIANRLQEISSDINIIIQVQFDGAEWWTNANPDAGGIHAREGVPDYLSADWKRDARDAVRQLVAHVQSSTYASSVIGYELFNGISLDCNFEVNDATPGALQRFRTFLRQRYDSVEALRQAWGDPTVDFVSATPQTLSNYAAQADNWQSRLLIDNPATMRRYLDSKRFREIVFQQIIIDFSSWIKEATQGRALAGARTGDFMANQWNFPPGGAHENDLNPIDLLLSTAEFDFFDIQPPYLGRHRLGRHGGGVPHLPLQALKQRNKLLIIQDDVPHLVKPSPDIDTLLEMKRLVATYSLFNGAYPYQFQMSHYKLNDPKLINAFKQDKQIYQKAVQLDRSSVAETAIVLDLDYQRYLGLDNKQRAPARTTALFDHIKWTWNRAGIPYDIVLLQDLPTARDYKLYIFVNTWDGSNEKRAIVDTAVKNSGKVALFSWADGLFSQDRRDPDNIAQFVGMKIAVSDVDRNWAMSPTPDFSGEVSQRFPLGRLTDTAPGEVGAADWVYAPSFVVNDPDVTALAVYIDGGEVAVAEKVHPNWIGLYSASAVLSPSLLRYAAQKADCFIYSDSEDLLYLNSSFIAVHAQDSGEIELSFPQPTALYEVYSRKEFPAARQFTLTKTADKTQLYFRGTEAAWKAENSVK